MNRIILASLFFATLLASSCSEKTKKSEIGIDQKKVQTENVKNDLVRVSYNQKINGYQVTAIWKPKTLGHANAIGPAVLEFKNDISEFTLTNNYFALPAKLMDLKTDKNTITIINTHQISVDYKEPNLPNGSFEDMNVPFLFIDLDFDGNKEIILTKSRQGQRLGDAYDAYTLRNGELKPDFFQITHRLPFSEIDFMTKLNKEKKELTLYRSGGVCAGSLQTYSLVNGQLQLTKIVRMENSIEANKCYEFIYSVENGTEKLIRKKESTGSLFPK